MNIHPHNHTAGPPRPPEPHLILDPFTQEPALNTLHSPAPKKPPAPHPGSTLGRPSPRSNHTAFSGFLGRTQQFPTSEPSPGLFPRLEHSPCTGMALTVQASASNHLLQQPELIPPPVILHHLLSISPCCWNWSLRKCSFVGMGISQQILCNMALSQSLGVP